MNGIYDNILRFHKAQPKGPGYLTLPAKQQRSKVQATTPKKQSESEASESEPEEDKEEVRPVAKRGRRGAGKASSLRKTLKGRRRSSTQGNKKSSSLSPFLRSSQRLRKQRNDPEPEKYVSSAEESSSQHSPSPPPPPQQPRRGRSSLTGRGGVRKTRNSRRKAVSPDVHSPEGEIDSGRESPSLESDKKDEAVPSDSKMVTSDDDKYNSEDETQVKKPKVDNGDGDRSPVDSSPGNPPSASKPESADSKKEEVNYTICHGNEGEGSNHASQLGDNLQPQEKSSSRQMKGQASGSVSDATPTTRRESSETIYSPDINPSTAYPKPSVGAPPHPVDVRSIGALTDRHDKNQREQARWGAANVAPRYGVSPGYPPVYNPALHGMGYAPHTAQGIPGGNYPYAMPYPWGHGSQLGASAELMQHGLSKSHDLSRHSAEVHHQYVRGTEGASSPGLGHVGQTSSTSASSLHQQQQHRAQMEHKQASRHGYTPETHSAAQGVPKPMEKIPLSHQSPMPSPLHQLSSPVSASSPLPQHMTHAFAQPPHVLSPDNLHVGTHTSHPTHFPYGFEHGASSLQQMQHLWQTQQMQHHQIAGIHPSHLPAHMPAHGLWYTHTQPMSHFMPGGGEMAAHYKKTGKSSKTATEDKSGSNHNANNNVPGSFPYTGPHLAKYQAQAFRNVPKSSSLGQGFSFSVEHLPASASKDGTLRPHYSLPRAHLDAPQSHDSFDGREDELSTSAILERTRTSNDIEGVEFVSRMNNCN